LSGGGGRRLKKTPDEFFTTPLCPPMNFPGILLVDYLTEVCDMPQNATFLLNLLCLMGALKLVVLAFDAAEGFYKND
jgi:hypothetical protein